MWLPFSTRCPLLPLRLVPQFVFPSYRLSLVTHRAILLIRGPRIFWSGASLRTEATGSGLVFFAQVMLADMNKELKGLRCVVSGSGKITMHVLEKLIAYGALPVTVSGSWGQH